MGTSVKKNFLWNLSLTISGYVFPLLTFPYVTRVLGAGNLGIANFAMSVVDYAVLFSTFGMTMVGIRYIAQAGDDVRKRNEVFCNLVSLHIVMSLVIFAIYIGCIYFLPQLSFHKELYFVGASKIILNVFLVEWLFQGMQDFRYVTIRTLFIRVLYVVGIFIFVRNSDDYDMYFYVTMAQVAFNAIVNWKYSHKYTHYRFNLTKAKEFIKPVFSMGINNILLSFYTTFNVLYLGFKCTNEDVGYFTTAVKLYGIFISVLTAYNHVFVPYLNNLYAKGELEQFKLVVSKSINLIVMLAIPVIFVGITFAPQIILLIAGKGFEEAVLPFQIILVQIIIVGIAQILENQILLSFKRFNEILICTVSSVVISLFIIIIWIPNYAAVAAAAAVAVPHIFEIILLYYFSRKQIEFKLPFKEMSVDILLCIPMIILCIILKKTIESYLLVLIIGCGMSFVYYFMMQLYVIKNSFLLQQFHKMSLSKLLNVNKKK